MTADGGERGFCVEHVRRGCEECLETRLERKCLRCGKLILVPGRSYEIAPQAVCRCDPHQDVEPEQRWKLKRAKSRNRDHKRRRAAERRAETAEAEVERLRAILDHPDPFPDAGVSAADQSRETSE